jgi:hypothetical protein
LRTSFYRSRALDPEQHALIQISLGSPRWWRPDKHGHLTILRRLAPDPSTLHNHRDDRPAYEREYRAKLDRFGLDSIAGRLAQLEEANPGKELVLLCFEDLSRGPEHWCHRTMFAEWWREQTGGTLCEL